MAVATGTRTTYDGVFREVYTPALQELQNRNRVFMTLLQRDEEQWAEGKKIHIRLHVAGSGGVGWSDDGTLPDAGVQQYNEAVVNYKRLYGSLKVDGPSIESSQSGYASELKTLEAEAKYIVEDLYDAFEYDLCSPLYDPASSTNDDTGVVGKVTDDVDTTHFKVQRKGNGIKKNMIVDITVNDGTLGNGKLKALVTAVAVASDTTKLDITLDTDTPLAGAIGNTYRVYRQSSRNKAVDPISLIVSASGTYLGVNRATAGNEFWKAQELSNSGTLRAPTPELLAEGIDAVEQNSPGKVSHILMNYAMYRKIAALLQQDRRYTEASEEKPVQSWVRGLKFGDTWIIREQWLPPEKIFCLDLSTWCLFQNNRGGFIDRDGQILHQISGKDAYEAAWRHYVQVVCRDPASNCVIKDVDES